MTGNSPQPSARHISVLPSLGAPFLRGLSGNRLVKALCVGAGAEIEGDTGCIDPFRRAHVDTWPKNFGQAYAHGTVFYHALLERDCRAKRRWGAGHWPVLTGIALDLSPRVPSRQRSTSFAKYRAQAAISMTAEKITLMMSQPSTVLTTLF